MPANPDPEDHMVPWDELPIAIRNRIGPALPDGHAVWACLRQNGRRCAHRVVVDRRSRRLVEAFWIE